MHTVRVLIIASCIASVCAIPCFIKVIRIPSPQPAPPAPTAPPVPPLNNNNTIDPRGNQRSAKLIACNDDDIPCEGVMVMKAAKPRPKCGSRFISTLNPNNGVTTLGAHPWLAYIVNQMGYTGSGALIDRYHVLTTAHKVLLHMNNPSTIRVYMGVHNPATMQSTAEMRRVDQIHIHPHFQPSTLKNDVAILRLNTPVSLGTNINIGTICLPQDSNLYVGRRCLVAGWGSTNFGKMDDAMSTQKQVRLPIIDWKTCWDTMSQENALGTNVNKYLDQNHMCAGGQTNKDACTQDGGAPLVCQNETTKRFHVVGLVSWGLGCGKKNMYGVYTDVSKYRNWIQTTTNDFYT